MSRGWSSNIVSVKHVASVGKVSDQCWHLHLPLILHFHSSSIKINPSITFIITTPSTYLSCPTQDPPSAPLPPTPSCFTHCGNAHIAKIALECHSLCLLRCWSLPLSSSEWLWAYRNVGPRIETSYFCLILYFTFVSAMLHKANEPALGEFLCYTVLSVIC